MRKVFLTCMSCLLLSSCANLFSDMSQRDTDPAKLFQAKRLLDQSNWNGAIAAIESLSAAYQATREVQVLLASAYTGRCGIDVLNLINGISSATAPRLFLQLFDTMVDATLTQIDDCILAETTLSAIGDETERTVDENLLMTFVQMGKIGAILNYRADIDDDNEYDPAVGDLAFDPCLNGSLPQADAVGDSASANQLVASVSILIQSLAATSSTIASEDLGAVQQMCTDAVTNLGPTFDFCNTTDATAVTADQRTAIRGMVAENSSLGLGRCTGDLATCACGN